MNNLQLGLRIDEDTFRQLRWLEKSTVRGTSDLVRFLIREEYRRYCPHLRTQVNSTGQLICTDCENVIEEVISSPSIKINPPA